MINEADSHHTHHSSRPVSIQTQTTTLTRIKTAQNTLHFCSFFFSFSKCSKKTKNTLIRRELHQLPILAGKSFEPAMSEKRPVEEEGEREGEGEGEGEGEEKVVKKKAKPMEGVKSKDGSEVYFEVWKCDLAREGNGSNEEFADGQLETSDGSQVEREGVGGHSRVLRERRQYVAGQKGDFLEFRAV